eukprot:gene7190-biopygen3699
MSRSPVRFGSRPTLSLRHLIGRPLPLDVCLRGSPPGGRAPPWSSPVPAGRGYVPEPAVEQVRLVRPLGFPKNPRDPKNPKTRNPKNQKIRKSEESEESEKSEIRKIRTLGGVCRVGLIRLVGLWTPYRYARHAYGMRCSSSYAVLRDVRTSLTGIAGDVWGWLAMVEDGPGWSRAGGDGRKRPPLSVGRGGGGIPGRGDVTRKRGHAREIAGRLALAPGDVVAVVSGDGLIHEVSKHARHRLPRLIHEVSKHARHRLSRLTRHNLSRLIHEVSKHARHRLSRLIHEVSKHARHRLSRLIHEVSKHASHRLPRLIHETPSSTPDEVIKHASHRLPRLIHEVIKHARHRLPRLPDEVSKHASHRLPRLIHEVSKHASHRLPRLIHE